MIALKTFHFIFIITTTTIHLNNGLMNNLNDPNHVNVPDFQPRFRPIDTMIMMMMIRAKRQSNLTLSELDDNNKENIFSTTMLPLTPVTMTGFKNSTIITTTTSSTGSTNTNHHSSSIDNRKVQSFISLIKIEDDFKPLFKGRIIPKNELNLTDKARKVMMKKTDGNINNNEDSYAEEDDIDRAVGGISGILEKLIRGPNKEEINAKSKPEDVYIFLSRIIQNEYGKSIKATIPRIYDYQFPISERISQRCFNSFAQFADRLRKHYIWPHKMIEASASFSSFNKFALRSYGDFDSCLDIVADDGDRRTNEVFFTGQYCLLQVELPLPELKSSITYYDRILYFNQTELFGTFSEYFMMIAPFLYSNPLSFGLCLPSTCSASEIERVGNFFLHRLHINIRRSSDCYSRLNMTVEALPEDFYELDLESIKQMQSFHIGQFIGQMNRYQILIILFVVASIITVLLATVYEVYHRYSNETLWKSHQRDRPKSFIVCFSFRYSLEQIFIIRDRYVCQQMLGQPIDFLKNQSQMVNTVCLDALKSIALAWICLSNFYLLGYQPQMISSLPHLRDLVFNMRTNVFYQIWLSVGLYILPYIAKHEGRPSLSFFFAKRFVRLLPSMFFLCMAIKLLPLWKNAGPLYNSSVEKILQPCQNHILRSLLFFADFYDYNITCLPHLWYISNEFQISMFGVFVLIFVYNRRKHAMKTFFTLIMIGILFSGLIAYRLQLKSLIIVNAIMDEIPNIFKSIHFNGFAHFQSYFAGMALGYYFRMNYSQAAKPFNFVLPLRILIALILLTLSSSYAIYIPLIFSHYTSPTSDDVNNWLIILYYATARILFIGPTLWIIIQCLPRNNIFTKVLSWSIFRICSHLSFQIYLWNLIIIWIYLFTKRTLLEINLMESFPVAMSLFILTVVISMFTFLLFEAPYRNLFRYYFESPRTHSNCSTISMNDRNQNNVNTTTTTTTTATTMDNGQMKTTVLIAKQNDSIRMNEYRVYDNPNIVIDS
ncbi:hypothetical protein HUG17_10292 [Dermatophagoides farinae]|uniref:Nose resistant-to-fluoxetine protein N-terminal domain-containing protein n=1 Tax=Dermatophagoides farinae TaxID=6954 RepID=A0A9D4SB53_DERFA|nr:hypothetical protein HUG17_10292 [Dermatophagoides farinae]